MEPCHSFTRCWQKLCAKLSWLFVICIVTVLKNNIFGSLFNLWLVMALHFQSWRKVQTIPFFSSLKCKSTRRLCEKGPGSPSESGSFSDMLLQECSRNSAAHHLRSQICCTGFLCVRVSFRIQHFYFFCTLHSVVQGWNTWLLRSTSPADLSSCQRRVYSLSYYICSDWHCCILRDCFENCLKKGFKSPGKYLDLPECKSLFWSLEMTPTAIVIQPCTLYCFP